MERKCLWNEREFSFYFPRARSDVVEGVGNRGSRYRRVEGSGSFLPVAFRLLDLRLKGGNEENDQRLLFGVLCCTVEGSNTALQGHDTTRNEGVDEEEEEEEDDDEEVEEKEDEEDEETPIGPDPLSWSERDDSPHGCVLPHRPTIENRKDSLDPLRTASKVRSRAFYNLHHTFPHELIHRARTMENHLHSIFKLSIHRRYTRLPTRVRTFRPCTVHYRSNGNFVIMFIFIIVNISIQREVFWFLLRHVIE